MNLEEIIDIIDDYLVSTGKHFIGLRAANDLLVAKGNTDVNLKSILEKKEIPHAYQTEAKPRQWRIPYSNPTIFKERRNEFLQTQPKPGLVSNNTNNKFTFKHFIILVIAGLVFYFLFFNDTAKENSSSSSNDDEYYVNTEAFTTYSKNDFDEMYEYVVHNNRQALQEMLDLGKIAILEKGTQVYLIDAGFGYDIIREKGSTQKLWIATERVSKQ